MSSHAHTLSSGLHCQPQTTHLETRYPSPWPGCWQLFRASTAPHHRHLSCQQPVRDQPEQHFCSFRHPWWLCRELGVNEHFNGTEFSSPQKPFFCVWCETSRQKGEKGARKGDATQFLREPWLQPATCSSSQYMLLSHPMSPSMFLDTDHGVFVNLSSMYWFSTGGFLAGTSLLLSRLTLYRHGTLGPEAKISFRDPIQISCNIRHESKKENPFPLCATCMVRSVQLPPGSRTKWRNAIHSQRRNFHYE